MVQSDGLRVEGGESGAAVGKDPTVKEVGFGFGVEPERGQAEAKAHT